MQNPTDTTGTIEPTPTRAQRCAAIVDEALREFNCAIVGTPRYQSDGRGGFFTTIDVNLIEKTV